MENKQINKMYFIYIEKYSKIINFKRYDYTK